MRLSYRLSYKIVILLAALLLAFSMFFVLNAGDQAHAVAMGPVISNLTPSGTISTTSTTIGADFSSGPIGDGFGINGVIVTLDGTPVSGCTVTHSGPILFSVFGDDYYANGSVSCPVTGLSASGHNFSVFAKSAYWQQTTAYGSFTVSSCSSAKPNVGVSTHYAYWASFADYIARELSVNLVFANNGADTAYGVSMTGSSNTNSVALLSPVPFNMGDLVSGASAEFAVRYHVPAGVTQFNANVTGSALDACGVSYTYPL